MRYMGGLGLFNPSKVAYDGVALRPAVPIAANTLTETVKEALAVAPPEKPTYEVNKPDPSAAAVVAPSSSAVAPAAVTPSGAPVVMVKASEPEEGPSFDGGGGVVVPINDRAPSGPPVSRAALERATVSVTADDWLFVAGGLVLAIGVGAAVYAATRKRKRAA